MSRKLSLESIQHKIKRALALQERGKICFAKAEALLKQVGERRPDDSPDLIDIGTGTLYELVDQFAEGSDIVWTHAAARRWQLRKVSKRTSKAMSEVA